MAALIRQLALVSESKMVPHGDVLKVSAALQKQATRDLGPIWDIAATVDAFEKLEDVPVGYWAMRIMDDIQVDGAAGIHEDENGQPFALITASSSLDTWSLTASHEAFEMLVDPFGNRVIAGDSPKPDQGRASFLVEVCDPSEAADYAYSVNGILVSDFYTPNYFDPVKAAGVRYSYTGALTEPRQVLPGGYLSWQDAASGHWWQEVWFGSDQPEFRDLGVIDQKANGNVRAVIDRATMGSTESDCPWENQIGSRRNHGGGDLAICRHPCGHVARANQRDSRRRAEGLRRPSRDRTARRSANPKMRS
jgi:hypothetical protein